MTDKMCAVRKKKIAIIGAGAAGTALAMTLTAGKFKVARVADCNGIRAEACAAKCRGAEATTDNSVAAREGDVVFIATPDRKIRDVCREIARKKAFKHDSVVIHLSGYYGDDILEDARAAGCFTGSMHPICSFHSVELPEPFPRETWLTLQGDPDAMKILEEMADALGYRFLTLTGEQKPLYHLACTVASNYFVALEFVASELLGKLKFKQAAPLDLLLPLIQRTFENLKHSGFPDAITGSASRGDSEVVTGHLREAGRLNPDLQQCCKFLTLTALELGKKKGSVNIKDFTEIRKLLMTTGGNY